VYDELPMAWAVELAEKYCLPCSQDESAIFNDNGNRGPYQGRLDVSIGIAFAMTVPFAAVGDQILKG
jgi:hypothetical protein